ncbi:MAG: MBL fold metallo-hydrolase [Acidobacteriota bacterium]
MMNLACNGVRVCLVAAALAAGLPTGASVTPQASGQGAVGIEYVAHACFVVTSASGTRVAIDPYNSLIWLGYGFPEPPAADAILITHPHFDHDASYYWSSDIPVFRRPGRYAVGDVALEGLTGKHAGKYGREFGQTNTIWVLELDGLRLAHLGDNGPLDDALIAALGRIDVLMIPIDSTFHILQEDEVESILERLQPRITVPMHYQIPALHDATEDLGPIDPWLESRPRVERLAGHTTALSANSLPVEPSVLVFQPSPGIEPWSEDFLTAKALVEEARASVRADDRDSALVHLQEALKHLPGSIRYSAMVANQLTRADDKAGAIQALERALAGAGRDDWGTTAYVRAQLARLYDESDQPELAARQYRLILASSHQLPLRERAEEFFAEQAKPAGEPAAESPEAVGLAGVDVYGSQQISAEQVEAQVGAQLRQLEALRAAGQNEQARELRDAIEDEIEAMGDFANVRISRIQYFQPGKPIYITIDLVDTADAATRMAFNPEPTAEPAEDPEGLLAAWQQYERTSMGLLSQGKIDGRNVECPAFHCIVGFAHPDLERFADLFESGAPAHKAALKSILANSSDAAQRGSAAYLLAHLDDGAELLEALLPQVADPSYLVRNNVLRVLQQIAREQKDLEIPLDPILQALHFPATTDRNKSLAVLDGLADRPALRPEIARRAGATLVDILELLQPNNHDYAYSILKKISGEDFGERSYDAWREWLKTQQRALR